MRLLLVTDSYPPLIGGADLQVQMIAHAMRASGAEVTVATSAQPGLPAREDDAGVDVPRLYALGDGAILMEYLGDQDGPAPTLNDVSLRSDEAHPLFEQAMRNIASYPTLGSL